MTSCHITIFLRFWDGVARIFFNGTAPRKFCSGPFSCVAYDQGVLYLETPPWRVTVWVGYTDSRRLGKCNRSWDGGAFLFPGPLQCTVFVQCTTLLPSQCILPVTIKNTRTERASAMQGGVSSCVLSMACQSIVSSQSPILFFLWRWFRNLRFSYEPPLARREPLSTMLALGKIFLPGC